MAGAPDLDPIPLVTVDDPHPVYRELREKHPVYHCAARDLWVLSRHADILGAVRDPATWSSARGVVPSGYMPDPAPMIVMDGPEHDALRKAVKRAFTPRRIDRLAGRIRQIAQDLLAKLPPSGEVDAFEAYTDPLPIYVMGELLGVDPEQRPMFKRCGDAIVYASGSDPAVLHAAQAELSAYLEGVFEERRRHPGHDLISVLLHESPEGRALSHAELLALCFLLLVAGTETTTSALGNALLLLERDRDARRRLLAEPSRMETAVEEILRFDSPVQGLCRVATRDVELHGVTIPEGARVHLLFAAANRDPRVFADAERFDIARSPNPHIAFGFGVHFCLGASLARMELRVGLEEWLRRAPDYALDAAALVRLPSDTNRGFGALPVSLG